MATLTTNDTFYTSKLPTSLRVAQILGITSTAFLAGKTFTSSFSATPAFLHAPAPLLAKQWRTSFTSDQFLAPAITLFSTATFAWLAYRDPTKASSRQSTLRLIAATLLTSMIPYSYFCLEPLNRRLLKKASDLSSASLTDADVEASVSKDDSVHALVDKWAVVNLGRTILSGVAAIAATWAALDRLEAVPAVVRVVGGADRLGK
ncbi:hypothetical protein Tdes44962_MAKER02322 [Teratosphaeria destructans]|uniref:DUF1772-domain-containing protein n=1 Tax=Teratosphaeria destructans TaxID=418781 RepID=A0A9W7W3P2_9PEZI|nr:hypothetical protein Tdes44962_MAKER02322 [Teratosphaeria destructans]